MSLRTGRLLAAFQMSRLVLQDPATVGTDNRDDTVCCDSAIAFKMFSRQEAEEAREGEDHGAPSGS